MAPKCSSRLWRRPCRPHRPRHCQFICPLAVARPSHSTWAQPTRSCSSPPWKPTSSCKTRHSCPRINWTTSRVRRVQSRAQSAAMPITVTARPRPTHTTEATRWAAIVVWRRLSVRWLAVRWLVTSAAIAAAAAREATIAAPTPAWVIRIVTTLIAKRSRLLIARTAIETFIIIAEAVMVVVVAARWQAAVPRTFLQFIPRLIRSWTATPTQLLHRLMNIIWLAR